MPREPRRPSSQSWHLPPSERRDLYLARTTSGALELLLARYAEGGVDPDAQPSTWLLALEEDLLRIARAAWGDGALYEAELRTARDGEREIRRRLESLLREHGIRVPTDPRPSEPPEKE